jgi:HEPN domain-containing protein
MKISTMVEESVEKWVVKAERDLSDTEFNLINGRYEVAAFLAHRAAEKALKALYILKFKRLWKMAFALTSRFYLLCARRI